MLLDTEAGSRIQSEITQANTDLQTIAFRDEDGAENNQITGYLPSLRNNLVVFCKLFTHITSIVTHEWIYM
jgi:hypothetical protein